MIFFLIEKKLLTNLVTSLLEIGGKLIAIDELVETFITELVGASMWVGGIYNPVLK